MPADILGSSNKAQADFFLWKDCKFSEEQTLQLVLVFDAYRCEIAKFCRQVRRLGLRRMSVLPLQADIDENGR